MSLVRSRSLRVLVVLLWAAVMTAGCATTSDVDSVSSNVSSVQMESQAIKKELAQLRNNQRDMAKDISALKERTEGVAKEYSLNAMKEGQSNLLTQTSDLSKEVQALKGRFEEHRYYIDKTIKELLAERDVHQSRIAALENEVKALKGGAAAPPADRKETPAKPETPQPKEGEAAKTKPPAGQADPQKLYDDAHADLKGKKYAEARAKFEKLTKDHPKHAMVPNAYFWTGETYYSEKKYEDAILAYETFLKKYPSHDKARGAMLKQGYSFIEMGDKKTGKVILERLIEKYPKSHEAELAEKKIAEILPKASPQAKPKKKS